MRYLCLWRNDCCTQTDVYVLKCSLRRSLYVIVFPSTLTSFHTPSIQAGNIQLLFLTTDGHGFPNFGDKTNVSYPFLEECKLCLHVLSRERDIDIVSSLWFLDTSYNVFNYEIDQIFSFAIKILLFSILIKLFAILLTYTASIARRVI